MGRAGSEWLGGTTWRAVAVRAALLATVGLVVWAMLWSIAPLPRAGYDTLWYEMFALRYSGASESEQFEGSWAVFAAYGEPEVVRYYDERDGWPWEGHDDPTRARWVGIYEMRPLFPLMVAVSRPLLGDAALILPSILAVVGFTVVVGLVAPLLIGGAATVILLGLSYGNPFFSGWLIHLTTDGLGLALWAAALLVAARYIDGGARAWLVGLFAVTLLASFNRQSGVVVTIGLGALVPLALLLRHQSWRRLLAATAVSAAPLLIFAAYGAAAGLPSIYDMLQDTPTRHFAEPDRPNIGRYVIAKVFEQTPVLVSRLLEPTLVVPLVLGVVGLFLTRSWWAGVMVASLLLLPIVHYAHPVLSEANRAFAPAWFNVNVGLAVLMWLLFGRLRVARNGRSTGGPAVA